MIAMFQFQPTYKYRDKGISLYLALRIPFPLAWVVASTTFRNESRKTKWHRSIKLKLPNSDISCGTLLSLRSEKQ